MNKQFDIIKNTRKHLLAFIDDLTIEEINQIPKGFNNNIIWNMVHLIAAQQNVSYIRSGLDIIIDEQYFKNYLPGTKPEKYFDAAEVEEIKKIFLGSIDRFESDCAADLFSNYISWTNRYGVTLSNIDEVLGFLPFHEGLHLGYIMALKRTLRYG